MRTNLKPHIASPFIQSKAPQAPPKEGMTSLYSFSANEEGLGEALGEASNAPFESSFLLLSLLTLLEIEYICKCKRLSKTYTISSEYILKHQGLRLCQSVCYHLRNYPPVLHSSDGSRNGVAFCTHLSLRFRLFVYDGLPSLEASELALEMGRWIAISIPFTDVFSICCGTVQ